MSTKRLVNVLTPLTGTTNVSADVVVYESRGCVLVLGDDAEVGDWLQTLATSQQVVVFAPGIDARNLGPRVTAVGRRVTHVSGHLGAFAGWIQEDEDRRDIGAASPNPGRFFDLVLDLSLQPLITCEVLPLGYFAPGIDPNLRSDAIEDIQSLIGRFSKPRYFHYQPELCTHSASGLKGCDRCINVCSAMAISSAGATIRVDPHLCQGCASCTLACPTGALSFKWSERAGLDERLQAALSTQAKGAALLVHGEALEPEVQTHLANQGVVTLQVQPLPAFGDELWLRALAMGASALVLLKSADLSEKTSCLMAERVAQMRAMLPAMGINANRLIWLAQSELHAWLASHVRLPRLPATAATPMTSNKSWAKYKRLAWIDGLRMLGASNTVNGVVRLPEGACWGEVRVNPRRCTLCFACTNLCPTRALVAKDGVTQQLMFQESACVQCGLCAQGCPEKAITMHPRLAARPMLQMTSTVLHQDEPFACKACGTPFVSRRLLASSLERLKDHPVMAHGGRESLMTCPACRQLAMMSHS